MCIRFRSRIQPRSLMRYASWLQADFQLSLWMLQVSCFVWHYKCWRCCMPCSGRWPQLFPEAASSLCNCSEQDIENVGRVPVMGDGDSKVLPCSGSFKHYNCRTVSAFFARFAVVDILTDLVLAMRTASRAHGFPKVLTSTKLQCQDPIPPHEPAHGSYRSLVPTGWAFAFGVVVMFWSEGPLYESYESYEPYDQCN